MVAQILPQWMQLFIQVLAAPTSATADVGLKTEVFRSIALLSVAFPKEIFKYLDHLLPPLFGVMVSGLANYVKTAINETEDAEVVTDEDGEVLGFEQVGQRYTFLCILGCDLVRHHHYHHQPD